MADWVAALGSDYQDYYNQLNPQQQSKAKRKYKKTGTPWYARPDRGETQAGANTSTGYSTGQATPSYATGPGGQSVPQSTTTTSGRGGSDGQYRAPGQFGPDINGVEMHATPGSFAAGIHGYGQTPDALNYYAENPYALYGGLAQDRFGIPAGGRAQGLFAKYLDPRSKAPGILGDAYPNSSLEWVNFGEQLFGSGKANGTFLSPQAMIQNIVGALLDETKNLAKGGQGVANDGQWNPVRALLAMDPQEGLSSLLDMIRGALVGTMPDDDLQSYLSWVEMTAQNYMSNYGRGSMGGSFEEQAAGRNWLTNLVDQLGPTLGL